MSVVPLPASRFDSLEQKIILRSWKVLLFSPDPYSVDTGDSFRKYYNTKFHHINNTFFFLFFLVVHLPCKS